MHQGVPGRGDTALTPGAVDGRPRRGRARVGSYGAAGVELAYDDYGAVSDPALVLIMGIGAQRILWDEALIRGLVGHGLRVIRFDHRDTGESSAIDAPVPPPMPTLARALARLHVDAPYTLSDMARDVVGLLDALAIERAHVVGASLGGMVGQHLAIEHPARLRSLTSIMSTPGGRRYLPQPHALRALFAPAPQTAEQAGEALARTFAVIGSPAWPRDGARLRELGAESFRRGANPRGFLRQFAALLASGDRADRLPAVRVPTLIIHGSRDPLIPFSAGRASAALIPNATWLPIAGMGHDMPPPLWPTLVGAIARHAARADYSASRITAPGVASITQ